MIAAPPPPVRPLSLFFLLAWTALSAPAQAVPPPPGSPRPAQRVCRLNAPAQSALAARARGAPFFPAPLAATTAQVIVVRVEFPDLAMSFSRAETESFFSRLKDYYLENSYGLLSVSATVTASVYRLPDTQASYGQGVCSIYSALAHDAAGAAGSDLDYAAGAPGGRRFDHMVIYHAGVGAETANDSGCQSDNIWSVFAPTVPPTAELTDGVTMPFTLDGVEFNGAVFVPEKEAEGIDPLGVTCHEYGHQLGLPDLYNTASQSVVGKWSLMDAGIYLGAPAGSNPAHLDAWSKQFLGFFSNPQVLTAQAGGRNFSLELALSSSAAYARVPISGVPGINGDTEYFLIEKRAKAAVTGRTYDDGLPFGSESGGFLVWHVDDAIARDEGRLAENSINNGSPHFGVDLVEAAGGGTVSATPGRDGDPFPGASGQTVFAAPLSNSFDGRQTGISLSGFAAPQLTLKLAFATDSVQLARAVNFPNPGGPAYGQKAGARSGTVTTIALHASRPPQALTLTLHDVTGALVRSALQAEIQANGQASATGKFVYEYDWDGRNDRGEAAAPGTYLYRFKADDSVVQTGKLVLIR